MDKKILIVEDEPDLMAVTVIRLETAGYTILQAGSAEEALEILKNTVPNLLLLDLLLPKMQGDVLCQQIRKEPRFRSMPIVLFTASILRVPEKFKEIGADDYIIKPFLTEDLLEKIKKFVG